VRILVTGATGYVGSRLITSGLTANLVQSLDHPMTASGQRLNEWVSEPPDGCIGVDYAIAAALATQRPRPVHALADPHPLARTDPIRASGDALRIRRLTAAMTPPIARPALRLVDVIPHPVAAAVRTGLDMLIDLTPRGRPV
jgi:nucleoside-diphosphate-sugar epimerase